MKQLFRQMNMPQAALLISILLIGGMIEAFAFATTVMLAVMLIIAVRKNGRFRFCLGFESIAVLCVPLGYLITVFYAVDVGMAFLGFLKYLSVALFLLLIMQYPDTAERTMRLLPYMTLLVGVISWGLSLIPHSPFAVEGRLAGFFEYPNTFAMLLLLGLLAALSPQKPGIADAIIAAVLLILIVLTGSRATLALAILSAAVMLLSKKSRKIRIITAAALGGIALIGVLLYLLRGDNAFLNRLFSFSFRESTFAGRLLYYADSFKLIAVHPFGLGYLGYSYLEPGIQSGVYAVRDVHNGVLQLMLDIGWIPAGLMIAAIVKSLFSKRLPFARKVMLAAFFVHILFDFDLSFTAMFFILLILLDTESGKEKKLAQNHVLLIGIVALAELYFTVHAGLWYAKACPAADAMYPFNTENKVAMMLSTDDLREQNAISETISGTNDYVLSAHSVRAAYAYSRGDLNTFITEKHRIFELAPFSCQEYEDYAYKLIAAIDKYQQAGDTGSAQICAAELIRTQQSLQALDSRLSDLGKLIDDQPVTSLPQELVEYINSLQ